MPESNKKIELSELLNSFEKADLNNAVSVLEWFYKSINQLLVSENQTEIIYNRLIEKGYKEISSAKEELDCYNMLMKDKESASAERIGYVLISLILKSLKEYQTLDMSLVCFIRIFNERFNNEKTYSNMMNYLNESIGKNIIFSGYINGSSFLKNGILEKVDAYKTITVNGERIPFIGYNTAIATVYDDNGNLLYSNTKVGKNYDLTNFSEIEKLNYETFGNNYNDSLKRVY